MKEKIKIVQKDTFEVILSAVNKICDFIRPTFGPSGNKIIIDKPIYKMAVDDGVQAARDFELNDPTENAVVNIVKGAAIKTNDRVGDGTTGSLIILQAIINEAAKLARRDGRKIEKELKNGLKEAKEQLLMQIKPIKTLIELEKVARIAYDDEKIAKLIADTWFKLGKDGIITIDRSGTMETFADITDGIKIDQGYLSPYMVTNPERMEGIIEKPYILLTDYRLTEVNDVLPIMELLVKDKILSLVIIAEHTESNALATLIVNKLQGNINTIAIDMPADADKTVFLEDLAIMIGAKLFSKDKGDKIQEAKLEDLGRAERFVSKYDKSVIIGPKGDKKIIKSSIEAINNAFNTVTDKEKPKLEERLARFTNKIAIIKVGAATEQEEKALKYKVDDAVHSVQSAYKNGVVSGGGIALYGLKTSSEILNSALKEPFRQLKMNIGLENNQEFKKDEAINVITGEIGNFMEVGVMDPVDVLIAGLESAVSIASLLLTCSGMIVEKPKELPQE